MNKLEDRLSAGNFVKIITGLGNTSLEDIKAIGAVYSFCGADMFDLTPDKKVFSALYEGIRYYGKNTEDFFYCVSFSFSNDIHGSKAQIDPTKCIKCGKCEQTCPHNAIKNFIVNQNKCIGCRKCKECYSNAIKYTKHIKDPLEELKKLQDFKIDMVELHVNGCSKVEILNMIKKIKENFPNILIGISISYENRNNEEVIEIIRESNSIIYPQKLIFQSDGEPMSGIGNELYSAEKAVKFAKNIEDEKIYTILSGGCNSRTKELAELKKAKISGIGYGSYARILISPYMKNSQFWCNIDIIKEAAKQIKFCRKV